MVSYPDLQDARPQGLAAAADAWQQLTDRYTRLEQDTGTGLTGPLRASGWAGAAATAAHDRLGDLDDEFEVAAMRARTAASVLRRAVDDFTDLQRRLRGAVDGAVAAGLTVDDDGRVTPPAMSLLAADDPDLEQVHRRHVRNAGIYTDLLTRIVAEATAADQRVARALTALRDVSRGQNAWEYHQAGQAARAAAAVLGLTPDRIPAAGTDPAAVRVWWAGLSADDRQLYLTGWPDRIGTLDGLPAADRDAANQLALRNYIGDNVNHRQDHGNTQHDRAVNLLNRLEDAETGSTPLLLLTFDPTGDGRAAVAVGDPDTAAHTALLVPGVGTELDGIRGQISRAESLQNTAAGFTAPGEQVSVIAWLGYDPPRIDTDIVTAPFGDKSRDGAAALDAFVDGLHTTHTSGDVHITAIGHSYGSTVLGEAGSTGDGLAVSDMVAVGSPGMRVDNASELSTGTTHTWVSAAGDDNFVARPEHSTGWMIGVPIIGTWLYGAAQDVHGPPPHDPAFGANLLHADTSGHSGYWDNSGGQPSRILSAQAAIIAGDYDSARAFGKAP
ncbi:alpha/beta hydrolase [Actinoplanes subglobosus]|uniref:Alpha/beta hydrolase n=1 Tax=Actinoplanes subglobosus TaxID=1547892 RepID=A0ABV8IXF5_9ACTN